MRFRAFALTAACVAALAGCERADERASDTGATTLTVYASLPLQGPAGPESQAVANGMRLALREAGGKAGELVVKLVVLDDATPGTGRWDPRQTAENARTVVRDRSATGRRGRPRSRSRSSTPRASRRSARRPRTRASRPRRTPKRASPRSTTPPAPGPSRGPSRATGSRRALLAAMRAQGCRRLQLLEERDLGGRGLALAVEAAALAAGIEVLGRDAVRADDDPLREAERVAERRADCALFAGALADWVPPLFDPEVQLVGVEAAGEGLATGRHGAPLTAGNRAGILHGSMSAIMQDADGQIVEAHSISAGLDYPGAGPEHAWLQDLAQVLDKLGAEAL